MSSSWAWDWANWPLDWDRVVGAVSCMARRSTFSSLPGSATVELGLEDRSLRSLSALVPGLRVGSGKEIKPPDTSRSGSSPAAISSSKSVRSFRTHRVFDLERLVV